MNFVGFLPTFIIACLTFSPSWNYISWTFMHFIHQLILLCYGGNLQAFTQSLGRSEAQGSQSVARFTHYVAKRQD